MRYVIVHYHFFKNAGSTIENILDRNFGEHWTRFEGPGRDSILSNAALIDFLQQHPDLLAVSSHGLRYPKPVLEDCVLFDLCFLRDPIARLYSVYHFFRFKPPTDDPLSILAKEVGMREFVSHLVENCPHFVNNVQVNMLANGCTYTRAPGERDLARSIERMLEMSIVGVVDLFNASMIAAKYFLNPVFPKLDCTYVPSNNSADFTTTLEQRLRYMRECCGRALYKQVTALNELDIELVRQARAEVLRRFRLVPDHSSKLDELETAVFGRIKRESPIKRPAAHFRQQRWLKGYLGGS